MKRTAHIAVLTVFMLLTITACSALLGGGEEEASQEEIQAGVAATLTKVAWSEGVESARQTSIASGEEAVQSDEDSTEDQVQASSTPVPPTATPPPEPTASPTVVHVMTPGEPLESINSHVTDVSSLGYAAEGYTYGDQYLINRFERPFSSPDMTYAGHLDITLTNLKNNPPWVYFEIILQEDLPPQGDATYGVEFDLDINGRGDVLVEADLPTADGWTTDGVRVYKDIDGDIGGENPVFSDAPAEGINGFEIQVFDHGQGDDPDLAWVRRDPESTNQLQIAVKNTVVGPTGYLWSIWADGGVRDPAARDYNDRWTFQQAGSPFPNHQFYPLQEVSLVDSTCRSWYGYEPTGAEPGICQVAGSGKGYKVCYMAIFGATSVEVCDSICQPECAAEGEFYCKTCNLD